MPGSRTFTRPQLPPPVFKSVALLTTITANDDGTLKTEMAVTVQLDGEPGFNATTENLRDYLTAQEETREENRAARIAQKVIADLGATVPVKPGRSANG
ncbi:MAG: hypothetical protein IT318_24745 [Anaerolineales bacterium]|nr:hypothetical protein [Anaerolineales bacterium]